MRSTRVTDDTGKARNVSALTREALTWLIRLTSGRATSADSEEFKRWLAQSAEHAAAWSEAVHLWRTLGPAIREYVEDRFARTAERATWQPWFGAPDSF